jgi:hypothetical protein
LCTITTPTVDPEVFRSAMRYDSLDRMVVSLNQAADGTFNQNIEVCCTWPVETATIFSLSGYDSRGNQTIAIDPKANTTVTIYDGASRAIQVVQHLRDRGEGDQPPIEGTCPTAARRSSRPRSSTATAASPSSSTIAAARPPTNTTRTTARSK